MAELPEASMPLEDDIPLEDNSLSDEPEFILESHPARKTVETLENMEKGHAAVIKSYNENEDILTSFSEVAGEPDIRGKIFELSGIKGEVDRNNIVDTFRDNPGSDMETLQTNAEVFNEMLLESDERVENLAGQIVDAASVVNTDPEIAQRIENQIKFTQDIQDLVDDLGIVETAGEIVSLFIPGGLLKDNFDATGEIFGAEELMRDMVIGFKSLPPEEQFKMWPIIKEQMLEAMPKVRALPALAAFLDPVGEEKLSDFSPFWAALDTADIALLGFGLAKRIGSLAKQLNGIRVLNRLGNTEDAADVNAASMVDATGNAAKAAGIDRVTAYNNASPFDVAQLDEAYTAELSTETLARLNAVNRKQKEVVQDIADQEIFLKEGLLTEQEREAAEEAFTKVLQDDGFENINVATRTPEATTFNYSLVSEGETLTDTAKMNLKLDDVGVWENTESGLLGNLIGSPTVFAKGTTKEAARSAIRLDSSSAKIADQLRKLQREALIPLTTKRVGGTLRKAVRTQIAELDDVLLAGDEANKMFTPVELRSGINGTKLDAAQTEAYYNVRNLYDSMWDIRNTEERRKLVIEGMKQVNLKRQAGVGKVYSNNATAASALTLKGTRRVWRDDLGRSVPVDELKLKELYDSGFSLTALKSPIRVGRNGDSFTMAVVKTADTQDLPQKVLHFKEGYVPRVNKNAYWFVKESRPLSVDGRASTSTKTLRYFDNKKEADEFTKALQKEQPDSDFKVLEDRELEKQVLGSSNIGSGSGLYTGARAQDPIRFGKEGIPAERFGAFEALSMNIQQLQNFVSRNEWRMGMEQRWLNTAKELGVDTKGKFNPALVPDTKAGRFLKQMGEQIQDWMGFPSKEERLWDALVQDSYEWAINTGLSRENRIAKGIHYFKHKDPVASMRAAAFHTLLGFFNPVQLWVQAQGASIAISLGTKLSDPLGAVRAMKNQFLLRAVQNVDDAATETIQRVASAGGIKAEQLVEMRDLWRRSGLEESILTTADHAASIRSHGIASDALRQTADKGLFFYRGGELFNRRTSFLIALDEFKAANKGAKVDDQALKSILSRSNDMMLNLTRANRASWQKGILSVPTQFLQVNAKMAESLLGVNGSFSAGERAKILFGQLALYGAAGVPMGNFALRWGMEMMGLDQTDAEQMDKETVKLLTEGMWGYYALTAFGADIDISKRGAIASGLETFTLDLLFSNSTITEKIFGAFGTVPHRFFQSYGELKPLAMEVLASKRFIDSGDVLRAVRELAKVTSTWNNAEKAIFMRQFDKIIDSRGELISEGPDPDKPGFSLGTKIGVLIGFQPSETARVRDLVVMNRDLQDHRNTITNSLVNSFWDYSNEIVLASTENERQEITDKYERSHAILVKSLRTPRDRRLVTEALLKRITKGTSKKERESLKYLQNFNDGRLAGLETIYSSFAAKGIIQTGALDKGEE